MKQIVLFAVAGGVGYLADTGVLLLLSGLIGPYWGRMVSFLAAVLTTWSINRALTFRHQRGGIPTHRELFIYALTTLGGGAVNFSVYAWLVYLFDLPFHFLPAAVAAGSLAGMTLNYWLCRKFVFTAVVTRVEGITRCDRS